MKSEDLKSICPACGEGELLLDARTDALYTLNPLGQLRGKKVEIVSVNPKIPDIGECRHAVCSKCHKFWPLEKTKSGVIRVRWPKIFVALVVWHGTSPDTDTCLLDLFYHHGRRQCECCGEESGWVVGRGRVQSSLLPVARSNAARLALQTDCEYILFVDQDTVEFDEKAILRMASHNLPIVSAAVCRRSPPYDPVHRYMSTGENNTPVGYPQSPMVTDDEISKLLEGKVQECFSVGMAFTLVKREVLEAIGPPYFRFLPATPTKEDPNSGWFHGEDTSFCMMAREKGFKSYVDCGVHLGHAHERPIGVRDWLRWHSVKRGETPEGKEATRLLSALPEE